MNRHLAGTATAAMQLFQESDETEVAAVYIVGGRRPSADEIRCLERQVDGLAVTVDAFGDICLRRNGQAVVVPTPEATKRGPSSVNRVAHSIASWNAGFRGLSEGVR